MAEWRRSSIDWARTYGDDGESNRGENLGGRKHPDGKHYHGGDLRGRGESNREYDHSDFLASNRYRPTAADVGSDSYARTPVTNPYVSADGNTHPDTAAD